MKGCGTSVTPITAGVRSDIERLLQKFIELPSVRFEHFVGCFNQMKFSLIFAGRTSENELREFAEKTLLIALSFCFSPYSFQVNVGGIYLLYSLYYLQPRKFQMQIRITPQQLNTLKNLLNDLRTQQHLDTCYTLYKLFRDNAFDVCAYPDEHNPLNYHRFDNKDDVDKAVENFRNTETFINEFSNDRLIPQLETLHDEYVRLKKRLFENEDLPEALALINENTMTIAKKLLHECEEKLEARPQKRKKQQSESAIAEEERIIEVRPESPDKPQKLKWPTVELYTMLEEEEADCMTTSEVSAALIELIHLRPSIWNTRLITYKDNKKKQELFAEIAKELKLTADDVAKRWANLKKEFTRERSRKISQPSGSATSSKKPFEFYNAMMFINETCQPRNRNCKSSMAPIQMNEEIDDGYQLNLNLFHQANPSDEFSTQEAPDNDDQTTGDVQITINPSTSTYCSKHVERQPSRCETPSMTRKRKSDESKGVLYGNLNKLTTSLSSEDCETVKDEFYHHGQIIASRLRSISQQTDVDVYEIMDHQLSTLSKILRENKKI